MYFHPPLPLSHCFQNVAARRARIADSSGFLKRMETENVEMEARLDSARRSVGSQRAALQVCACGGQA